MSVLPPELAKLSRSEKLDLANLLVESVEPDGYELTESQMRDLKLRIAEYMEDPDEGQTLEEYIATEGRTP